MTGGSAESERQGSLPWVRCVANGRGKWSVARQRLILWQQRNALSPEGQAYLLGAVSPDHRWAHAHGLLKTTPSFITNTTLRMAAMSSSGLPLTATMSASFWASMVPKRSSIRSSFAAVSVRLPVRLVRAVELYAKHLGGSSDRTYVITQAIELALAQDSEFQRDLEAQASDDPQSIRRVE